MSVVDTVEILKGSDLTEAEYFKAALLGWCIELVSELSSLRFASY
jgi:farnesyl diphosphate synthase